MVDGGSRGPKQRSGTAAKAARWPGRLQNVDCRVGDDEYSGCLAIPRSGVESLPAGDGRSLALASALLAPQRGFLPQLEEIYQTDLDAARHNLLLLGELGPSWEFLADDAHREQSLQSLCRRLLGSAGFFVVDPPPLQWRLGDQRTLFHLRGVKDRPLHLCTLLGPLGFAQLCDDLLSRPVPLLVRPWCPARGLLQPVRLPGKVFSQNLRVRRVAPRRLLLFDRRASLADTST